MALSNIFREPHREITETAIGVMAFLPAIVLDYTLSSWISQATYDANPHDYIPLPIAMFLIAIVLPIAAGLIILAAVGIHATGEGICNSLERSGVHLRPRRRW
jgi:hypothetical protein